ncbi:unnamed protein product [Psylliodes chrysocephalus]|uniref:Cilia- and flagella-associated protein 206 n=1 Tax=Psylliodes chrysocephalus TaxID=3402493 RepID=A0A9P0CNJ7_9CUCU|nr:unnamed protein product [Psylliodes chrysocephala]
MVSRIERNIVKEILRECQPKNLHPNEDFVTYYLKLLLLDPNWGITENLLNSRANVQTLVKHVISELESKDSVKMMTLKMQFYFMWSLDHINNIITNTIKTLINRLTPLKEQIMISTIVDDSLDVEKLRRVLVMYMVFKSGLGNPTHPEVYSEGVAALKSIISEEELKEFSYGTRAAKEEHLNEMTKLITGIRLFNKYCQRGGAEIPDLADLYRNASKVIKDEISTSLTDALDHVTFRTSLLEKCYGLRESVDGYYFEYISIPKGGRELLENAKDELIHYRQYELFIRKILKCLEVVDAEVEQTDHEISALMEKIIVIVRARLAVPVYIIFPLFEQIADYFIIIQQQVLLLARYSTILNNMKTYCKQMRVDYTLFDELINVSTVFEPTRETFNKLLDSENPTVEMFQANELENEPHINLQYLGFCSWRLVNTNGFLVQGNPRLGIAKFRDDYFVFSSYEAGKDFSKKPKEYLKKVLALARTKPQLINFLLLQNQLVEVSEIKTLVKVKVKVKKNADKGVQSEDDYVIPPYKEKSISWNIWDIKRNVLQLAHLTKCKTTGTQTIKSHSSNPIRTQTIILKEQETQTRVDNYTSVPSPLTFIYGLRGRKDDKQFVIDLTRPIQE